ncbi:Ig-like domain-containing protein [Nonomuraea sp. NPDC050451]|uniref:Ig-like domain-containing protein n=1 Tax=Nonomuraea sp. NPDC050451 TaxID=3364364 RepID=UPI003796F53D
MVDEKVVAAKAKAVKTGKRVALPSHYTETMKVWANTDGKTLHAELSTEPVQLKVSSKDSKKSWQPVDTSIVTKSDGALAAKLVKTPLTFGGEGDKTLVTAKDKDGTVAIGWNNKLPKPTVDGNKITYRDVVAEGADLVLTALPNGFAQDVVLRTRPKSPIKIPLSVTLPEGRTYGTRDGKPQLMSAQGAAESRPLAAQAVDAKAIESPEQGKIGKVDTSVTTDASGNTSLVLTPDAAFLADPSVAYPVIVPMSGEWIGAGDSSDTFVSSVQYPNSATLSTWLRAGKSADGELWRTYLRYVINGTHLDFATIHDADLRLWNYHANGCGTSVGVGIVARRLTSAYHYSTLTWANQPSSTGTNAVVNTGGYSATLAGCSGSGELYYSIQDIVQQWADGTSDYGLMIRAATEGAAGANWRQYRSDQYTGTDGRGPVLFIDYTPADRVRVVFNSSGDLTSFPTYGEALAMEEVLLATPDTSVLSTEQVRAIETQRYAETDSTIPELQPLEGESDESPTNPDVGDSAPPSVIETTPADGASDVPTDTGVTVTFSEDVRGADLVLKDADGGVVATTTGETGEYGNATVTFTPGQPLKSGTVYTATVSGATDLWDNVMSPHSWSFTTTGPDTTAPTVSGTDPAKDATDVPVATPVRATFSEPVSEAEIILKDVQGTAITGAAAMDSTNKILTFTPQQPLAHSATYTAEASKAKDTAGNIMATPHVWSFTTAAPDTTAPTVSGTDPAKDATDVPVATPVRATFSEPVSEAEIILKDVQGTAITGAAAMDSTNKILTFTPQQPLAHSATYTAEASKAKDTAGNIMATPHVWSFTTVQAPSVPKTITLPVQTDTWLDDQGTVGPNGPTVWAGAYGSSAPRAIERTYLKFDTSALAGKAITEAKLELWNSASFGCGAADSGLKAQQVTGAWSAETLSWRNQPQTTTNGEALAKDPGGCIGDSPPSDVAWTWPVTDIVRRWASGQDNHGLMVRGVDESTSAPQYDRGFHASETEEAEAHPPTLKVTYTDNAGPSSTPTTPPPGSDTTPPTILAVEPADGAENVPADATVKVTFSEPVTNVNFVLTDIDDEEVPGSVTMSARNTVLTFTPDEPLDFYYWAEITAASDTAGNAIEEPYGWTFLAGSAEPRQLRATAKAPLSIDRLWTRSSKAEEAVVPTTAPELMVKVSGRLTRHSTVEVEVEHDPGARSQGKGRIWSGSAEIAAGSVGIARVPGGKLKDGWQVRWRARATSAAAVSSWTEWQSVKIDLGDSGQASTPKKAEATAVQNADFDYEHMSLEMCSEGRRNAPQPNASFGWQKSSRYNACWSKLIGVGDYIKKGEYVRPQVEDGYLVEATTVYHTYLGTADGAGVIGGTGLTPQTISMWTRLGNIVAYLDGKEIPADKLDEYRIGLVISSKGESGSTCNLTPAVLSQMKAKGWQEYADGIYTFRDSIAKFKASGDTFFRFYSDPDSDRVSTCTLRPRLYNTLDEWDSDGEVDETWDKQAIPLWNTGCFDDKGLDVGKVIGTTRVCGGPSHAYAPTTRCDELTLGQEDEDPPSTVRAAANNTYGVHTGACIFTVTPVFTMSKSAATAAGKPMDAVIDHIADALKTPDNKNTWPYKLVNNVRQVKTIPGNADVPGSNPLTRLLGKKNADENRKKFNWERQVNGHLTKGECDLYYWELNPSLKWVQHYTQAGLQCDEFPFASTYQGKVGNDYSVRPINGLQNRNHGWTWLRTFYSRNRLADKDPFLVRTRS